MRLLALLPAILLALAAPAQAGRRGKVVDRVAIVVDGEPIFESDLGRRTRYIGSRDEAEDQLIDEALVVGAARERGLTVASDEVDQAIDAVMSDNGLDAAGLAAALADQHMSLAEYRFEVERQILLLRTQNLLFAGTPVDEHEQRMKDWVVEHRAHAFVERRKAR